MFTAARPNPVSETHWRPQSPMQWGHVSLCLPRSQTLEKFTPYLDKHGMWWPKGGLQEERQTATRDYAT